MRELNQARFPRLRCGLALLCLAALPFAAQANKDSLLSGDYAKCLDRAGAVNAEIQQCMAAEWQRQDKHLNRAYQQLLARQTPGQKQRLQDAQRLWLKYTEANCAFYFDPDGGTLARLSASECEVNARAARAHELENLSQ